MAGYVDGYIIAVPTKHLAAYRKTAKTFARVWLDCGAIGLRESVADDVKVGKWTSFPRAVKLKKGETVVIGAVTYASRRARDRTIARVMKDKRFQALMPKVARLFDGKRMIWGGFKIFVEA